MSIWKEALRCGILPLALCLVSLLCGCRTPTMSPPVAGAMDDPDAAAWSAIEPFLLLTSDATYSRLEVEIDAVDGAVPSEKEIQWIAEFLQNHCRKPDGVHVRLDDVIGREDARGWSDKALGAKYADGPEVHDAAFAYFLFYDSELAGFAPRGGFTTTVPYHGGVFIDVRYFGRFGLHKRGARRALLTHEMGHLLGLSAGRDHGDGLHCTNSSCLMNEVLDVRPPYLPWPGPSVRQRELCSDCRADLERNRDTPPAANLRLSGLWCIRTEPGYHVVTSPGLGYVHTGPLEGLSLDALDRRRRETFARQPATEEYFFGLNIADAQTARAILATLSEDPLSRVRDMAETIRQKLDGSSPPALPAVGTTSLTAEDLTSIKPELLVELPGAPEMEPWSEGPVWRDGEVFFANRPFVRVTKDGQALKYLDLHVGGTYLRGNGHLLLCEHFNKALLDVSPDGELRVVADQWNGEPLPGLNDVTADADGNLYFTSPQGSSLDNRIGRIFRVSPDGKVDRLAANLAFPNGLEVDPASEHLYVIESQTKLILKYALPEPGQALGEPETFFDLGPDSAGGDGCAFDEHGNLWVAEFTRKDSTGRIVVLSSEGKLIGEVAVPARLVTNLWFGGENRDELFIATGGPSGIFRAKTPVKGAIPHPAKELKLGRTLDLKLLNAPIQKP